MRGRGLRPWILDADIKGAFDNVSHDHILKSIGPLPGRELVKQWLRAGYVEAEMFHETESGTPQGGIVSPMLLNVALHGLQNELGTAYGYIRYADDLVVSASTREKIEAAKSIIEEWLKPRGLILHPEKTRIVHIDDGFNFLGFNVRRYRGKCLIKPQKEKVLTFLAELRLWLNKHKQVSEEFVIRHFNPILRGWSNNYKHVVSKQVFAYVSSEIWRMIWKWSLRRHPNKGKDWVRRKYFCSHNNVSWTFHAHTGADTLYLFEVGLVHIERHIKIKGTASPDDPSLHAYWINRRETKQRKSRVTTKAPPQARLDARAG
jgi:RNA-directed DNA polymerase